MFKQDGQVVRSQTNITGNIHTDGAAMIFGSVTTNGFVGRDLVMNNQIVKENLFSWRMIGVKYVGTHDAWLFEIEPTDEEGNYNFAYRGYDNDILVTGGLAKTIVDAKKICEMIYNVNN